MGIKDFIEKLGERSRHRKELMRSVEEQTRIQQIVEDRQKSSNERELERFMKEEREEQIKEALQFQRQKRDEDIKFGHNPLNAKNIMKSQWEVLKEKNQFANKGNMFVGHEATVMRNNPKLLRNNKRLCS